MARHPNRTAWALITSAALLWTCEPGPVADDETLLAEVVVTLSAPKAAAKPPLVFRVLQVAGTVQVPTGATLTELRLLAGGQTFAIPHSNGKFDFAFDTAQSVGGVPLFACNATTTLVVEARATPDAFGSAQIEVEIDNCAPTLTLEDPPPKSVWVRRVHVQGKVSDKRFQTLRLSLDGAVQADITAPGPFDVLVDRGSQPTADLDLVVQAMDLAGNATELVVPVRVVQGPVLQGDTGAGGATVTKIQHMRLGDIDGDGVTDAVVAAPEGVVLRRGIAAVDAQGVPTGGGTGDFETPPAGAKGKVVVGADVRRIELFDFDADGDLDVLAAGVPTAPAEPAGPGADPAPASPGVVWAILNSSGNLHLADARPLPHVPLASALGDLELDGQPDLLIGTAAAEVGLVVVRLRTEPTCGPSAEAVPCGTQPAWTGKAKVFQDLHVTEHKGVDGIVSVVVADFFQDAQHLPDVCVGESGRPLVSCYRNAGHDALLDHAVDGFFMADCADTRFLDVVDWTLDGIPDLTVGGTCGRVRWLIGKGDGTFAWIPSQCALLEGIQLTSLAILPVGPGGALCLVMTTADGTVLVLPLPGQGGPWDSKGGNPACLPGLLVGGALTLVVAADIDDDGVADLVTVQATPPATPVTFGTGAGLFEAATALHLCAVPPESQKPGPEVHALATFALDDFSGDGRPDLLLVGKRGLSLQPQLSGGCVLPPSDTVVRKPVWPMALYLNDGKVFSASARVGEFAPYATGQAAKSGAPKNCPDQPDPFGDVTAVDTADFDGDGRADLVAVRDQSSYPLGFSANSAPVVPGCPPCLWKEANEVDALFGIGSPEGSAVASALCCRNYALKDGAKAAPLKGYGLGAPIERASLLLWRSGSPGAPLGFAPDATANLPAILQPALALAAGRNPVAVVATDLDGDQHADIATVQRADGDGNGWLAPRLRVFAGDGKGHLAHVAQTGDSIPTLDEKTGSWTASEAVGYRVVGGQPRAMVQAQHAGKARLFTLGEQYDQVTVLQAGQGPQVTRTGDLPAVGKIADLAARDLDGDGKLDLLLAMEGALGLLRGLETWFASLEWLAIEKREYVAIALHDMNQDGALDVLLLDREGAAVDVLVGDGSGGFLAYGGRLRVLPKPRRMAVADLDGDGRLDLAVQSDRGVAILRNRAGVK